MGDVEDKVERLEKYEMSLSAFMAKIIENEYEPMFRYLSDYDRKFGIALVRKDKKKALKIEGIILREIVIEDAIDRGIKWAHTFPAYQLKAYKRFVNWLSKGLTKIGKEMTNK